MSAGPEPARRPTRQRAAVAAVMAQQDGFVSAQQLHAVLRSSGRRIGLATVYRALQLLAAEGEVDMLRTDDGEAVYRRCVLDRHHHHLLCRRCHRTVEVEGADVETWADEMAERHGFSDVSHHLELFGTCSDCSARAERTSLPG